MINITCLSFKLLNICAGTRTLDQALSPTLLRKEGWRNQVRVYGFSLLSNRATPVVHNAFSFHEDFHSSVSIEFHLTEHAASLLFMAQLDHELHFKITFDKTVKLRSWQIVAAASNLLPFPVPQPSFFNTN